MEDGDDEVMEATYRALCEHGYAGLTVQDIADRSEKSKSTLHYHYDTKREILLAFLDYLYDGFEDRLRDTDADTPAEEVVEVLSPRDDAVDEGFRTAILEMKAQSPYDEHIRGKLVEFDDALADHLEGVVRRGVEDGVFRDDVEAASASEFLVTLGNGLRTRSVTVGKTHDELRETVERYVETRLVAGEEEDG